MILKEMNLYCNNKSMQNTDDTHTSGEKWTEIVHSNFRPFNLRCVAPKNSCGWRKNRPVVQINHTGGP